MNACQQWICYNWYEKYPLGTDDGNYFFIFIIVAFVDNLFMSGINVCYTRYAKYP